MSSICAGKIKLCWHVEDTLRTKCEDLEVKKFSLGLKFEHMEKAFSDFGPVQRDFPLENRIFQLGVNDGATRDASLATLDREKALLEKEIYKDIRPDRA